ncbi:MAG: hypothetical protein ACI4ET_12630 [Bilifractor sp.]
MKMTLKQKIQLIEKLDQQEARNLRRQPTHDIGEFRKWQTHISDLVRKKYQPLIYSTNGSHMVRIGIGSHMERRFEIHERKYGYWCLRVAYSRAADVIRKWEELE